MSYPQGSSVNDGISTSDSSMVYASIEDATRFITTLERGSLLAEIDITNAFRLLPVHLSDCHLLGMHWEGQLFIDQQLPFGLRSVPVLFNAYADALEWILRS